MQEIINQYFELTNLIRDEVTPMAIELGRVYQDYCRDLYKKKAEQYKVNVAQPTWLGQYIEISFIVDTDLGYAYLDFDGYHQIRLDCITSDLGGAAANCVQAYVNGWEHKRKEKCERIAALEQELAQLKGELDD